jgi:prepilin-type N-terminal cleavage/methylation domain-containing protein
MNEQTMNVTSAKSMRDQRGFTLIELMVSILLFLIVTGAVYGLLAVARRSRSTTNQKTELMKSVRVALNSIQRDALNVGYSYPTTNPTMLPDNKVSALLGIPNDIDTSRDLVPPVLAGDRVNTNTFSATNTDQITFVYRDPSFNVDAAGNSQTISVGAATRPGAGIDQVVPITGDNSSCRVNDIMLITGKTSTAMAVVTALPNTTKIQFGSSDVLGFNSPTAADDPIMTVVTPAAIRRVILVTYRVLNDGTLVRRIYGNDTTVTVAVPYRDEPLVYGVEAMQVQYVLDDGSVTSNPLAGPDGVQGNGDDIPANQLDVRQVRITVTARSTEKDATGQPYKVTLSSTFSTRNLGYTAA